jgi:hypothetical protein
MSKWTKNKGKDKILEQRKAYAKINRRDRSKASIEVMREKGRLKYTFAYECWKFTKKGILSPKGLTWAAVFEEKWGTPLQVYVEAEQQRQREKQLDHNTLVDPTSPLP